MKTFKELRLNEKVSDAKIIKDYEQMKKTGKSDSAILDILISKGEYRKVDMDRLRKVVGDHKRKGIFKR